MQHKYIPTLYRYDPAEQSNSKFVDPRLVERCGDKLLTLSQTAAALNISRKTLTRRFKDQPSLYFAYQNGRAKAIYKVSNALLDSALEAKNVQAQIYLSEREAKRDEIINEDNILNENEITVDSLDKATRDKLRELAEKIHNRGQVIDAEAG